MKMTVCCENVYAVAMETACRHSKQELIFMYLSNINQIWVVFILSQPKFSLTHGYVKYAPALLHLLNVSRGLEIHGLPYSKNHILGVQK